VQTVVLKNQNKKQKKNVDYPNTKETTKKKRKKKLGFKSRNSIR
jgi:hypothetical protein